MESLGKLPSFLPDGNQPRSSQANTDTEITGTKIKPKGKAASDGSTYDTVDPQRRSMDDTAPKLPSFIAADELFKKLEMSSKPPSGLGAIPVRYAENGRRILCPGKDVLKDLVEWFVNGNEGGAACRLIFDCHRSDRVEALERLLPLANNRKEASRLGLEKEVYFLLRRCLEETTAFLGEERRWTELDRLIKICDKSQEEIVFANLLLDQLVSFSEVAINLPKRESRLGSDSRMDFGAMCKRAVIRVKASNDDPYPWLLCLAKRCKGKELDRPTLRGLFVGKDFDLPKLIKETCFQFFLTEKISDEEHKEILKLLK